MLKLLAPAALLVVAVTAGGCARATEAEPPVTPAAGAATSTVPPTTADPAVAGWKVFTSAAGGYRLRYPPGWRVKESSGSGGPVLSLLPPKGTGISVLVTSTAPPEAGAANVACRPIDVGGLAGRRCQDSVAMVVTTTIEGRERWYVVTGSLRRPPAPAGAYDRVLASFRPT